MRGRDIRREEHTASTNTCGPPNLLWFMRENDKKMSYKMVDIYLRLFFPPVLYISTKLNIGLNS